MPIQTAEKEVRAVGRNVGISAQKVRLVVDLVRGKKAKDAIELLRFTTKGAAEPISKIIASAIANGVENKEMNADDLIISKIFADEAPTRNWRRFAARGRFRPLLRRASHITVVLEEKADEE